MKCKKCGCYSLYVDYYKPVNGEKASLHRICKSCREVEKNGLSEMSSSSKGISGKDYDPYSKQIDELRSDIESLKKEVAQIKGYSEENNQSVNGHIKLVSDFYCKHGRFIGALTDCYDCKNEEKAEKLGKEADKIIEDYFLSNPSASHEEHLNVGYGLVFKVAQGLYKLYGDSLISVDSPYTLPEEVFDAYCGILMGEAHRKEMMRELYKGKSLE